LFHAPHDGYHPAMELTINTKDTPNPTVADVAAAFDAAPHPNGWTITLDADEGYIEATAQADGHFRLSSLAGGQRFNAAAAVDAMQTKAILTKYFNGDASWRGLCQWKAQQSAPPAAVAAVAARDTSQPPTWAIAMVVGAIALVVLISYSSSLRAMLPFANSDYFYVGLIALPMVMLVVVMIVVKVMEARNASHWPQTTAKILKSGMEVRHHQHAGEATTVTSVPAVEYEFTANGRAWRGNRISIGEDSGGANSEATLARFKVGTTVPVFYDPKDPSHCVLVRDIPKGAAKGCAAIVAFFAVIGCGFYFFTGTVVSYLDTHLPTPDRGPFVFAAICFGLLVLLFFIAARRSSKKAQSWPSVRGKVVSSGVDSYQKTEDNRTTTLYTAAVEYAYQVHGVEYHSRQINLGMTTAGSQGGAEKVAARYPMGAEVEVHYDPANPATAALENPTGYTWIIFGAAIFCFAVAAFAGGLFSRIG
jgi:hypothetical protein